MLHLVLCTHKRVELGARRFAAERGKVDFAGEIANVRHYMAHDHSYPESLHALLTRLPELTIALGPRSKPGIEAVQKFLQEAVAARADGNVPAATAKIGAAMDTLARLADELDPQEATLMRMLSAQFRQALSLGDRGEAQRVSDVMRKNSGATIKKQP